MKEFLLFARIYNTGSATPAALFVSIYEKSGELRGGFSTEVAPYSTLPLGDVFSRFQAESLGAAMIEIASAQEDPETIPEEILA